MIQHQYYNPKFSIIYLLYDNNFKLIYSLGMNYSIKTKPNVHAVIYQ